jgi:putative OPT family oligopeptide transporter
MPIEQLREDEIRSMSLEEKDRWWLEKVYRGDMPQLTIRSGLTGMALGGVLSLTNLYVGMMTGWTLGVGITSVILAFAMFKAFSRLHLGTPITLLENNAMQSIATAAGYMTGPLVSSVTAYMLVTRQVIPVHQVMIWLIILSILGVLIAFPLKRRFINEEQMPFPEGRAAGIVMDDLHSTGSVEAPFKSRILVIGAVVSALVETVRNEAFMTFAGLRSLNIPESWDTVIYRYVVPKLSGTPLKDLTVSLETSLVLMAAGGLMGIKTGVSLMIGACVNYVIFAPLMIQRGIIEGVGFKNITMWGLWGGVAMMTTASLAAFFSKPRLVFTAFRGVIPSSRRAADPLAHIELPIWVSVVGIPLIGIVVLIIAHRFFAISYGAAALSVPLAIVFTVIAVNSTGLTSITPIGALGKLTQLTYGVISPGNMTTNIMTAGITGEVASNASNLLMDIKPGYMLGGKPRHQAAGHVLGIFAGALVSVPVFYLIFHGDLSILGSERFPMPAAQVWVAVAELLTKGLAFLHPTAQWGILIGCLVGISCTVADILMKGRFPLSGVAMGIAFVIPFSSSFAIFLGALLFWGMTRLVKNPGRLVHRLFVKNHETVCAGVIAGGAMAGILLIVFSELVFT